MAVHPIEYRYSFPEMRAVWEEAQRLRQLLAVEVALAHAWAELGRIPVNAAEAIAAGAGQVQLTRVKEIDAQIDHETMAVVRALTEQSGDAGRFVHLGATSSDILDTALALQLRDTHRILADDLQALQAVVLDLAERHKATIMAGRTHGQHALPITFGFKVALWADEIQRHRDRLDELKPRLLVGKMSGAVGSYAGLTDDRVERLVMARLGLSTPRITSQVVPRDGLAEFMAALGLIAATLDKIGHEIRNLARTEIKEVEEPFKAEQVGSSTMPQKRNPHRSERLCGLARIIKANVTPALEDISLEHERDISHSSVERAILPESCILTDYLLHETTDILAGLRIYPARMRRNLALSGAFMGAEAVMLRLVDAGLGRQEAHELVRRAAWQALDEGRDFAQVLKEAGVGHYLDEATLATCLDPENYLGECVAVTERVINELRDQETRD